MQECSYSEFSERWLYRRRPELLPRRKGGWGEGREKREREAEGRKRKEWVGGERRGRGGMVGKGRGERRRGLIFLYGSRSCFT